MPGSGQACLAKDKGNDSHNGATQQTVGVISGMLQRLGGSQMQDDAARGIQRVHSPVDQRAPLHTSVEWN